MGPTGTVIFASPGLLSVLTRRGVLAALCGTLAGCQVPGDGSTDATTPGPTGDVPARYWYPHPRRTGNRTLAGSGNLREARPMTIPHERPVWLVALPAPGGDGSDWVVVSADGTADRYRVADGEVTHVAGYDPLPDQVPVVRQTETGVDLVRSSRAISPMAPPAFADDGQTRLALGTDGDLLVTRGESTDRVDVGGLPDGRIVRVGEDRFALLGAATDRYRHGALGDDLEGGRLVVVDATGRVQARQSVGPPAVIEAQAPLVGDLGADSPVLVVPVSDSADGARIAAFSPDGTRIATGPIHGSGWRHPLAIAPLGPDGQQELAVVRKPHVEHVLELYRLDGTLSVRATLAGFRSHTYGSRQLDGALAADLDGDGAVELLVPTTPRDELAAVRRREGGVETAWTLGLGGGLRTNLTGVAFDDGVAVGAGTTDGVRVWQG
ncbi:MAG: hypothetical protein ACI8XM_001019 [Haloarculaceae archaeon]|jgi:hypothetical protein